MANLASRKEQFGIHLQTDWATIATDTTAFKTAYYQHSNTVPDVGVDIGEYDYASATSLIQEEDRTNIDVISGIKQFPFTMIADKRLIAYHLAAALQNVTEAATTPFQKTFNPIDSPVDFNGDAGYVFSIARKNFNQMATSDAVVFGRAILNELRIEFDNMATGTGRAGMLSGTWYCGTSSNLYLSGTWTNTDEPTEILGAGASANFDLDLITTAATYSDIECWRRFALVINNNVTPLCRGTGGQITQWSMSPQITVEIDLYRNTETLKLYSDYLNGYKFGFSFGNGDGTADGGLLIQNTSKSCVMTAPPHGYADGYDTLPITATVMKPSAGWSGDPLITFSDAIDQGF